MASFLPNKVRSMFGHSEPTAPVRPFSMASTVTVVPPSPLPPTHAQPSTLAALEYQSALIGDFWSGSAAGRAPPPPGIFSSAQSEHSRSHFSSSSESSLSSGASGNSKNKWAHAMRERERGTKAREESAEPEPKTRARLLFCIGFLFPLLWLIGAALLFFPTAPRVETDGLPVHAHAQEDREARYRKAEEKWAKRCLWAWVFILAVVTFVIVGGVVAAKGGS